MTNKTVILSDIHNKYELAEMIIQKENPDNVVFLGDHFDSLDDTVSDATSTAKWLADSLQKPNRVHLIGNHDLGYLTDNFRLKCSGYTSDKYFVIEKQQIDWSKLKLYHWLDDWLCTHAGVSNAFLKSQNLTLDQVLDLAKSDRDNIDDATYPFTYFKVGRMRGGQNSIGGPLWCDYSEFADIPKTRQIFGHTVDFQVRHQQTNDAEHYCLDTRLQHYAVYQDEIMTIQQVSDDI